MNSNSYRDLIKLDLIAAQSLKQVERRLNLQLAHQVKLASQTLELNSEVQPKMSPQLRRSSAGV